MLNLPALFLLLASHSSESFSSVIMLRFVLVPAAPSKERTFPKRNPRRLTSPRPSNPHPHTAERRPPKRRETGSDAREVIKCAVPRSETSDWWQRDARLLEVAKGSFVRSLEKNKAGIPLGDARGRR